jgi:diguanylate cyclase (GGDEF)-like protein
MSALDIDGDPLACLTFTDLRAHTAQVSEIARLGVEQGERMLELQDAQAALLEQATHDGLTGLPNRALVVDRIGQALSRTKRSGRCTAVIFVDLDRFKVINDTRGHATGDQVLKSVADTLVAAVRPMDTVARIGGDEFVILAPDMDSPLNAAEMSARLVARLQARTPIVAGAELITASVGLSVSLAGRGSAEILVGEADKAMYKAKSLGGNGAAVFDKALGQEVEHRAIAQRMLRSALDDGRITGHFQPIVDLSTGTVAGFEALARLIKPDGSMLSPAEFIPVAEDTGLVMPLGSQMLTLACEEACRWQGEQALTVAVNLSARQFEPGDLVTVVADNLERSGLDPSCLQLELTETALIDLHPRLLEQLGRIRDLGVEVGLDDFGTGYASLTHLRRLPLTFVKIDQSFVQGLCTDDEDERIVSAVVDLAANLGLRAIAEGVETEDQLARLRELGCPQAQGFLFARPLPTTDLETVLHHPAW